MKNMVLRYGGLVSAWLVAICLAGGVARAEDPFRMDDGDESGGGCSGSEVSVEIQLPSGDVRTTEFGGISSFNVRLSRNHGYTVRVTVRSEDVGEGLIYISGAGTFAARDLYFTTSNWYVWQRVDVRGVPDCEKDGNTSYAFAVVDPAFPLCPVSGTPAINDDVPVARVEVSPNGLTTSESRAVYTMQARVVQNLSCAPSTSMSMTVHTTDATEGLVRRPGEPAFTDTIALTLTPSDYQQWHAFEVQGQRDGIADGNVSYRIETATSSSEPAFSSLASTVSMSNQDVPITADTCYTRCGLGIGAVGAPPGGCSCAADCGYQGNCCVDAIDECSGLGGAPAYPDPLALGAGSEFYTTLPSVATAAGSWNDAPQGTGASVADVKAVVPTATGLAGFTKISLNKTETHEERSECALYQESGFWKVRSWVNWALNPDAYAQCSASALRFPRGTATPPTIRQSGHAQDVGAQDPQVVDLGPATADSLVVLTAMKIENVDDYTHARCLTYVAGGNWKLKAEGSYNLSDVWCDAEILTWPAGAGLTSLGQSSVYVDNGTPASREIYLGAANDRACFMAGVNYYSPIGYPGGGGQCEISEREDGLYLTAKREPLATFVAGVACYASCVRFDNPWPKTPTLRGVVGPGESPAAGTDVSINGSRGRVNLYQSGAYDRPLVVVEGWDPTDSTGPNRVYRSLSAAMRSIQDRDGVDIWIVNPSGYQSIKDVAAPEVARAVGIAYTYDADGPGPGLPWNQAHPGGKVVVSGFSQGGLDTRVALAAWEDGTFGPAGALPIPGLPNPNGPPPVSLFVSANGPQQGAEAPVTLQHAIHDLEDAYEENGDTFPPAVSKMLDAAPTQQLLRQQGCDNAHGVFTEWCQFVIWGARIPQDGNPVSVFGNDACVNGGQHPTFQSAIDSLGLRHNGFPSTVRSIGVSNGSFSRQGCHNTEAAIKCTGDPVVFANGLLDGSIFSSIEMRIEGTPGGSCDRYSNVELHITEGETEGGDLSPARASAIEAVAVPPSNVTLLRVNDRLPSLFVPTQSALACPGVVDQPGCGVIDALGRRDHATCDAVCRDSNRNPANPRFHNVFSNTSDRNGLHTGLDGRLVTYLLAYVHEYLVADADGYFGSGNPYLFGGPVPPGESGDCDDTNAGLNVSCGGGEIPPPEPEPVLHDPF